MSDPPKLNAVAPKPMLEQIRPTTNKIEVNASSLVDLKVELAKKQREFRSQALNPQRGKAATKGPAFLREAANAGVAARNARDREASVEESKDFDKSRRALEAKAVLYDRIQKHGELTEEEAEQFLVDFEAKLDDAPSGNEAGAADPPPPPPHEESEDDWVSYKDAFGRDRRCLRKDLQVRLNAEKDVLLGQLDGVPPPPPPPPSGGPPSQPAGLSRGGAPELLSADMRRELERKQWEAEALAAAEGRSGPVGPVHFQAVVPGEIRQLGTGYYNFSTDAEQRANQMDSLNTLRSQTAEQRRRREAIKKRRETAQEARIAKIKRRKGLAPDPAPEAAAPEPGGHATVEPSTVDELLAFYKTQSMLATQRT
eukprot:m.122109 g.122109  ORF g.122109 m.122109 type:complete len:369 (+) comp13408_c0_seq3:390-1496(+)